MADQGLIVHMFAPLDGPQAPQAYEQIQRIWAACREQFGMVGRDIAGLPGATMPTADAVSRSATESVLAFQESQAGVRQAVLRRVHDVLNLSVALAQPAPEGVPQRSLSWSDHEALWARVAQRQESALLGEVRVFLARAVPGNTGGVPATAGLGQALDRLLPYREDRPYGWWHRGTSTTGGFALWDTGLADTAASREIVLAAAADQDAELSAWVWSDGTAALPSFARYLMHAAKLRAEARLLDSWHSTAVGQDTEPLIAELSAILELENPGSDSARLLRSLQTRLRGQAARLTQRDTDMARLEHAVSVAQRNLATQPDCGPQAGIFAADQSLARYISGQVSSDRNYLQIELREAKNMRELAAEAPGQLGPMDAMTERGPAAASDADRRRRVFVVYGRDGAVSKSFFHLLYAVGLQPLEWERLIRPLGTSAPFLGEVVRQAPQLAQASLVLLSPDDVVELHSDLFQQGDHGYERERAGQARPNVLFELGLAYMAFPERTVIVEVGKMRPVADLAGLNVIRFDGSAVAVKKVVDRLVQAGCPADTSDGSWLDPGRFTGLEAYRRGPGTSKA